jgi:hypothetical protein
LQTGTKIKDEVQRPKQNQSPTTMTKHPPFTRRSLLMTIAFLGIFIYGLLAALPGSVLPTLERKQFLPNDSAVGTFLLINAIGAVVAYLVSGPIIDRIGKKVALTSFTDPGTSRSQLPLFPSIH